MIMQLERLKQALHLRSHIEAEVSISTVNDEFLKPWESGVVELNTDELGGIPFGLTFYRPGDGSLWIKRKGPKLLESHDNAYRVFLIPTNLLKDFQTQDNITPKDLYEFLKKADTAVKLDDGKVVQNGGRYLALDGEGVHLTKSCVTLVIKSVFHQEGSDWFVPDVVRYQVTEEGLQRQIVDRVMTWDKNGKPLDVTRLLNGAKAITFESLYLKESGDGRGFVEDPSKYAMKPGENVIIVNLTSKKILREMLPAFRLRIIKDTDDKPYFQLARYQSYSTPDGVEVISSDIGAVTVSGDHKVVFRPIAVGDNRGKIDQNHPVFIFKKKEPVIYVPVVPSETIFFHGAAADLTRRELLKVSITENGESAHLEMTLISGLEPLNPVATGTSAVGVQDHVWLAHDGSIAFGRIRLQEAERQKILREERNLLREITKQKSDSRIHYPSADDVW